MFAATRRDAAEIVLEIVKVVEKVPLVEVDSVGGMIHVGSAFTLETPARIGAAIATNRKRNRGSGREVFAFMGAIGGLTLERAKKFFLRQIVREILWNCWLLSRWTPVRAAAGP